MSGLDMAKARMLMPVMAGDTYRNYPSLPEAICFAREAATMLPAAIEHVEQMEAKLQLEYAKGCEYEDYCRDHRIKVGMEDLWDKRDQERQNWRLKQAASELSAGCPRDKDGNPQDALADLRKRGLL